MPARQSPLAPGPKADPPANGERGEMREAVEVARRAAEERATAEIIALEEDLEREREQATKALQEVQAKLERAEARVAETADAGTREESADPRHQQRDEMRRQLERELEREMLARERELTGERDEALRALRDARARIERAEAEGAEAERARDEA
ncbi:MAG: hypothetical protein ACRDL6_10825, partial [Solirubrobacterales bacterium]